MPKSVTQSLNNGQLLEIKLFTPPHHPFSSPHITQISCFTIRYMQIICRKYQQYDATETGIFSYRTILSYLKYCLYWLKTDSFEKCGPILKNYQYCNSVITCKIRLMLNSLIMNYQRFVCKCLDYKNKRMMSRQYFKQILYAVLFSHRVIFALLLFETFSFRLEFAQTQ